MPEIKEFPKKRIAFLTSVGPFSQSIPGGLARLFAWAEANHVLPQGAALAVFPDDPGEVAAENLRTELGFPVGPEFQGSGEVLVKEVGPFEVATMVYHRPEEIERAYSQVFEWLHQQGYHDAGAPMETYLGMGADFAAEIAVPIVRAEPPPAARKSAPKRPAAKRSRSAKKAPAKKSPKKAAKKARAKK